MDDTSGNIKKSEDFNFDNTRLTDKETNNNQKLDSEKNAAHKLNVDYADELNDFFKRDKNEESTCSDYDKAENPIPTQNLNSEVPAGRKRRTKKGGIKRNEHYISAFIDRLNKSDDETEACVLNLLIGNQAKVDVDKMRNFLAHIKEKIHNLEYQVRNFEYAESGKIPTIQLHTYASVISECHFLIIYEFTIEFLIRFGIVQGLDRIIKRGWKRIKNLVYDDDHYKQLRQATFYYRNHMTVDNIKKKIEKKNEKKQKEIVRKECMQKQQSEYYQKNPVNFKYEKVFDGGDTINEKTKFRMYLEEKYKIKHVYIKTPKYQNRIQKIRKNR